MIQTLPLLRTALLCTGLALLSNAFAQVKDQLQPTFNPRLEGFLAKKLDAALQNRILAQDHERLIEPFRNQTEERCWQSEFWGKWFTSAVLAYQYQPSAALKNKLDQAVTGLIATQTPEGYIGNYAPAKHLQQWDIWGRKYCMLGLLAYYDLTKDKKSLQATRMIADHLIKELRDKSAKIVLQGNHRGMAASSVLEPMVLLYNRTNEKRYLDFAKEIVQQWESSDGPQLISKATQPVAQRFPKPEAKDWYSWQQGQKAYEMMSCYEGLLELYRVTGNEAYRKAVEATWENIRDTEINIVGSGASVECWFGGAHWQTQPIEHYQEVCVSVTWIKLSYQLFRLTGEAKYADAIEQSYYNALLGSMTTDGADWSKYTPINGERRPGSEQCHMGLNCCVASGPRALFLLPQALVMSREKGINLNFYAAGSYHLKTPKGQNLELILKSDYPVNGRINLQVKLPKPERFELSLRIPQWSSLNQLSINGQAITNPMQAGTFLSLTQDWKSQDELVLDLDMRGKILRTNQPPQFIAIQRGPLVLARDARLGGASVDESISPVLDKDGTLKIEALNVDPNTFWFTGKAQFQLESYLESGAKPEFLNLCDYASAGSTYSAASRFRVWFPQVFNPRKN